jgi:hypothetical protein
MLQADGSRKCIGWLWLHEGSMGILKSLNELTGT